MRNEPGQACETDGMIDRASASSTSEVSGGWARVARVAVLLSGSGRTLENLLGAAHRGMLDCEFVAVVSSKPDVRGLAIAQDAGIPAFVVQRRDFLSDEAYTEEVESILAPFSPDLILLAGFLRKLVIGDKWAGRVLNIHPALLPEMAAAAGKGFYGDKVHAEVLRRGAPESGATVHVVDNGYDTGPVVDRVAVPVLEGDTVRSLADRVFAAECDLYPRAVNEYIRKHRDWLLV
jgi:formyltetrahydrofolate-dependent phosphoribosylglycinamide formyltransferase